MKFTIVAIIKLIICIVRMATRDKKEYASVSVGKLRGPEDSVVLGDTTVMKNSKEKMQKKKISTLPIIMYLLLDFFSSSM